MERGESGKSFRRVAEAGEEWKMHTRPHQMNAHEQRHGHAKEHAEQREPKIVEANALVVGAEDAARQKAVVTHLRVICSAVVGGHECPGKFSVPSEDAPRE